MAVGPFSSLEGFAKLPTPFGGLFVRGDINQIDRNFIALGLLPNKFSQAGGELVTELAKMMRAAVLQGTTGVEPNTEWTKSIKTGPSVLNETSVLGNAIQHELLAENVTQGLPDAELAKSDGYSVFFVGIKESNFTPAGEGGSTTNFLEGTVFEFHQRLPINKLAELHYMRHRAVVPRRMVTVLVPARPFLKKAYEAWEQKFQGEMDKMVIQESRKLHLPV